MAEITVEIDDGLLDTLRTILPPGWDADDWIGLKAEAAIGQARIDQRKERIERDATAASAARRAVQPGVPEKGDPTLITNDEARERRAGDADADDD